MDKNDFFIVGCGLAGAAFAHICMANGKSFKIIDNQHNTSSAVAGGLFNPIVLKYFTPIDYASQNLAMAQLFYRNIEKKLGINIWNNLPLWRKFASIEEQNNWYSAADKSLLKPYLEIPAIKNFIKGVNAPLGFGNVKHCGFLDVQKYLRDSIQLFQDQNFYKCLSFKFEDLIISDETISYQNENFQHMIFAEGFSLSNNPFFNYLPLDGTKGETLIVEIPQLKLSHIIKADIFIIPIGNHQYRVGATYNWSDKTEKPTSNGLSELTQKLEELIQMPYTVIKHEAGIRPTVRDRKPLIGTHHVFNHLHILNGLGTRGVILAPVLAEKLYNHIVFRQNFEKEYNISRFDKKFNIKRIND